MQNAKIDSLDSRIYEYMLPTYVFNSVETPEILENQIEFIDAVNETSGSVYKVPKSLPKILEMKRSFRIDPLKLENIRKILNAYVGTKNYHNYTQGKSPAEASAIRIIKSFNVCYILLQAN